MNAISLNTISFNAHIGNIKQINIKYHAYQFFNDMVNIKDFDSSLLKVGEKSYKDIGIYWSLQHCIHYNKKIVIMKGLLL